MKRGATDLCGILPVDKPAGMTSHDVVAAVRRATGERRVGHAGTLDPFATGLLVVLVGPATRLAPYLTASDKTYEALIAFGAETETCDVEGAVVATAPVPDTLMTAAVAEQHLRSIVGDHEQTPPAFSAVHVDGRKAYELARRGEDVILQPRHIRVAEATLLGIESANGAPAWRVRVTVSKGTYVRALARDLGRTLGTVAHLAELRRTISGALSLVDAHDLEAVRAAAEDGRLPALFTPARDALGMPVVDVSPEAADDVAHGRPLAATLVSTMTREGDCVAIATGAGVVAVYRRTPDDWRPAAVLGGLAA